MTGSRVVRRVAKRTYDRYSTVDYGVSSDNLNPLKPTQLESQLTSITKVVQAKVVEAFNKANVDVPEELYKPDVSPATMLNAVENLIKKLQKNPVVDLANQIGLDALASSPILGGESGFLDNPMKLDCEGVELPLVEPAKDPDDAVNSNTDADDSEDEDDFFTGDESSYDDTEDEDSDSDDGEAGEKAYQISYHNLLNDADAESLPSEYTESDCGEGGLAIPTPSTLELNGTAYKFEGWYTDEIFNTLLADNKLKYQEKDVDLYAMFQEAEENDSDSTANSASNPDLSPDDDDDDCGTLELAFLKIILIIVIILGILVKVLVIVYNIQKVQADIIKEAQLAWINPPLLQSIIAYVMQRLSAVIFQIVGMILLKLWAMLNLDCISENAVATVDQINQALSGLIDLMGQVDSLAIDFKGNSGDFRQTLRDAVKNMREQLAVAGQNVQDQIKELNPKTVWENTKKAGKNVAADLADTYTNPATYLAMVPPEIRTKVMNSVNAFKQTKKNAEQVYQSLLKTKAILSNTKTQDPPRGADISVLL